MRLNVPSFMRPAAKAPSRRPAGPTAFAPLTEAPPGSYDPQLDFQGQSANLGYEFSGQEYDAANANRKAAVYGGDVTYVDPQTGEQTTTHTPGSLAALLQQRDTALTRANTSHDNSTADITRSFANLAKGQTQGAYSTGQELGGYQAAAAQARGANQDRSQGRLDQSWRDIVGATNQNYDQRRTGILANLATQQGNADQSFGEATASNGLLNSQLKTAKIEDARQRGNLPTIGPNQYATLAPGESDRSFAGVLYGATPGSQFLSPLAGQAPTADSVLATHSLLGTNFAKRPPRRY